MPIVTDAQHLTFRGWTFRYRPADRSPARVFLLLHGWTGDENSMGIFANLLPADCAVIAPRAPYRVPAGGWSWREVNPGSWGIPSFDDLQPGASAVLEFLDAWSPSVGLDAGRFHVIGFSQGAAMSYVLAALSPERVASVAALSGFLPSGIEVRLEAGALRGKPVYVAHGVRDEMVPVERARQAVRLLESAGAQVRYCESDGGHKVGRECLKGMENLLKLDKIATNSQKEKR